MTDQDLLTSAVSELFADDVTIEVLREEEFGDAAIKIVRMQYSRLSDSGNLSTFRQSAVVLCDSQLDLPQFAVWPKKNAFLSFAQGLIGRQSIQFLDSPKFAESYFVHGWNEQAVRLLFTHELRNCFLQRPGWSARGVRNWLVVYRENEVCDATQLDQCVADALRLVENFQKGEEALDDRPDIRREATISDVVSGLEQGGGLAAAILKRQLKKTQVTPQELETFVAQQLPRETIPPGLKRQVVGDNLLLVFIGLLFLVVGIAVPWPLAIAGDGEAKLVGIILGTIFPLVGGGIAFFTLRHRIGRNRLLREGLLTQGRITDVKRSSVEVNNARRYLVHIDYHVHGHSRSTIMHLYANVEKARELQTKGTPVRLLVDPKNDSKVICLDTLLVF